METLDLGITRADFAQRVLTLNGEPYSLKEYPMFVHILNSPADRRLMRSGRQVSKTTIMSADLTLSAIEEPYTGCLYCNSSQTQSKAFSVSKLSPFLHQSPMIYHTFLSGRDVIDNIYNKRLSNLSSIEISYFSDVADRVRGRSARTMYLDETQDMLYEAMIDAEECLSAAKKPKIMYAGTSKTTITPLEYLWGLSTKKEWVVKCSGCGKYNRMSKRSIGLKGIICTNCGKSLNTYDGLWVPFNDDKDKPIIDGYWIPQIVMPMHCCNESKWHRLLEKMETYPETKFDNEVMGLPCGDGETPITEEMLKAICVPGQAMMDVPSPETTGDSDFLVAGIDWGGGGKLGVSRTTLHIYAGKSYPPTYRIVYGKIYDEGEPSRHVEDIAETVKRFGCGWVYCDHGGGNFAISRLRQLIPNSMYVVPVMYTESSTPLKWDDAGRHYVAGRTLVIDEFFADLQKGLFSTFDWEQFKPFARDMLNVRQIFIGEELGKPRRVWRHGPRDPDDSLHSLVFGWIGCRILSGRRDFSSSSAE